MSESNEELQDAYDDCRAALQDLQLHKVGLYLAKSEAS